MNRRSFIKLTGLVIAVATMPSAVSNEHKFQRFTLIGDGITDDTRALQALFDGDDVFYNGEKMNNKETVHIPNGVFKIDNVIKIGRNDEN